MDKIIIKDNKLSNSKTSKYRLETIDNRFIITYQLTVLKDADILLDLDLKEENKFMLIIDVLDNVRLSLTEVKKGNKIKWQTKANLGTNSTLNLTKLNDMDYISESSVFNLNGEGASVNLVLKTVSYNLEKYDINTFHNAKKTSSNIITNGLNIDKGKLNLIVTTNIKKGYSGCVANQANRIINLTNNHCKIQPNLLIDEYDVTANHSALIGSFSEQELFYLKRLGISHIEALGLLTKGFMLSKIDSKLGEQLFSKYWRVL